MKSKNLVDFVIFISAISGLMIMTVVGGAVVAPLMEIINKGFGVAALFCAAQASIGFSPYI